MYIPRELSDEEAETFRLRIETTLNELGERGESEFETLWPSGIKAEEKRK